MLTGVWVLAVAAALWLALGGHPAAAAGRYAIVFATGGLGDQSFNDSAYEGIQRAKAELGIEFDYAEPTAIAEYERLLTLFAQSRRYDLIISIGFDQADAVAAVADRFPNQRFAIVDTVVERPNVAAYVYREPERGFLLGVIAGLMTQRQDDPKINAANVIGVVGGMDIPLINANIAGYIAGARYVNPEADVRYSYVGHWADPARGKELALAQFDQGVDIIWGAAGQSGLGVIQAAQEANKYVIGADSDQGHLAPEHVLTNGMKLVNNTVFLAVQSVEEGRFQPGIHLLGVAEGALGYSPSLVPDDIRAVADDIAQRIARGELVPPDTIDAVDAWLAAHR
ncbi:MAG: BMP family ABC transporter substrate-binding protein [Limnochordales bacterium]